MSPPTNDRDVIERAKGYTLQDASFMHQSRDSCKKHTSYARDNKHLPLEYTLTSSHGRS